MGTTVIRPGVVQARASVKINNKQLTSEQTFYRGQNERPAETKARAEQWVLEKQAELRSAPTGGHDRTIAMLVEDFLVSVSGKARSTQELYRQHLNHFQSFASAHHAIYVKQITEDLSAKYQRWLLKTFTRTGPKKKWESFRSMMEFEVRKSTSPLKKDPSKAVTAIFPNFDDDDVMDFTEEEQRLILDATKNELARMVFAVLNATGLRAGEAAYFPTRHLDIDAQTGFLVLHVRMHTTAGITWRPKTKTSKRAVPIMQEAMPIIQYFIDQNGQKPFLFGGDRPIYRGFFGRYFAKARKVLVKTHPEMGARFDARRPGDSKHWLSPHSFRKTFGTRMLNRGMTRENVRDLLGHTDLRMGKLYAHLLMPAHIETIKRFSDLFGAVAIAPKGLIPQKGETYGETRNQKVAYLSQ